jgi:hypothetical protein
MYKIFDFNINYIILFIFRFLFYIKPTQNNSSFKILFKEKILNDHSKFKPK